MNSDRPVSTREEDHFNRWNLAKGVAAELAIRHDYGICVGVYGPWGAGKTSFLKFVEAHLKEADHHDVIWQNGWLGHSWEIHAQLLFQRIFESVGEDIATKGQRAAQSFKEWLNLAAIKLKIGAPAGIFSAEVSTSGVAGFLHQVAQIDLVKLREVLAQKKESKPFIVFIDDIDRQETQEIKELFRLLRFFSELPGVNVLIAMDPEIVAPALQEAYKVDGFQVLEKFIQVPLKLPIPKSNMLLQLFDSVVETVFNKFEQHELEHLHKGVYPLLLKVLKTPRQIRVLGNTLRMSVQVLQEEINRADLIFVNALNISHPDLVQKIFESRELLLGTQLSFLLFESPAENAYQAINRIFDRQWGSLGAGEVLEILKLLFPQIKGLTLQTPQYSQYEVGPRYHKRLCHDDFFHRYFEFCISDDEIKETEIDLFIEKLNDGEDFKEGLLPDFFRLLRLDSFRFILGLESRLVKISPKASKVLAMLFAASAGELSTENAKHHIFPGFASPWNEAANLIPALFFSEVPFEEQALQELIRYSDPVTFALEWAHEARKLLGDDDKFWEWFNTSFAQKVDKENQETDEPSFLRYKHGKTVVLHDLWKDGSSESAVQSQMLQWLSKAPEQLVDFLLLYVTHGVVLVGKPKAADDLSQAEYKRLRGFLNFEAISLCLAWLNQNQEWLQALEKWEKTLLFQFSEKFVADASLAWSQSKGARFFHAQSCPHAQRIKDDNKTTGSPPKSLRPHGCVDKHQAKALVEAQSLIETLSKIPSIGRQDY